MISVVIATLNDERTLGETLGALVPAAVDALVREVIVVDAGSTDHTLEIADDAGARIFKASESGVARIARGCDLARGDWLLILDPLAAPAPSRLVPRGRGAQTNAAGRFESLAREGLDDGWTDADAEPPKLRTTLSIDRARTIINRNDSPDIGFDRSINPYRGCRCG